ncbi:hypothetical protein C1646_688017, partial [Rhizophagus diaphanus]
MVIPSISTFIILSSKFIFALSISITPFPNMISFFIESITSTFMGISLFPNNIHMVVVPLDANFSSFTITHLTKLGFSIFRPISSMV